MAFILNPTNSAAQLMLQDVTAEADKLHLQLISIKILGAEDLEAAFARIREARVDGLLIFVETVTYSNRQRIIDFAAKAGMPALYTLSWAIVPDGGLASYGPSIASHYERAAVL